jgi:hypothetical protein
LPSFKISVVMVVAMIVGVLAVALASRLGRVHGHLPKQEARTPLPAGTLETGLFSASGRGDALREAQRHTLESYGWVNREAGLARIPIERAMDLEIEGRSAR